MPGLCFAGESPEIQGFSPLQKTLSSILGQKVVQQPQQTTTSLEKPATKRERQTESERERREKKDSVERVEKEQKKYTKEPEERQIQRSMEDKQNHRSGREV